MGHHEANGKSDNWYTPKYVFDKLGVIFDIDVASPGDRTFCSVPAKRFITERSLEIEWGKENFIWCNPPFGGRNGIEPWLEKAYNHGNGVSLSPDRTSCPWWQKYAQLADAHLQVKGKIKFIMANGDIGTKPGNGTTLFAFGDQAVQALLNGQKNKLGLVFKQL